MRKQKAVWNRIKHLKESIRDKRKDEHGMTIVEVMVAFVLVLLAIAMITTAATMATKIQKNTQESQKKTALMTELAYQALTPSYDKTENRWKIAIPSTAWCNVSNESLTTTRLTFAGEGESFQLDVKTAELHVSSGGLMQAQYGIYQ